MGATAFVVLVAGDGLVSIPQTVTGLEFLLQIDTTSNNISLPEINQ